MHSRSALTLNCISYKAPRWGQRRRSRMCRFSASIHGEMMLGSTIFMIILDMSRFTSSWLSRALSSTQSQKNVSGMRQWFCCRQASLCQYCEGNQQFISRLNGHANQWHVWGQMGGLIERRLWVWIKVGRSLGTWMGEQMDELNPGVRWQGAIW